MRIVSIPDRAADMSPPSTAEAAPQFRLRAFANRRQAAAERPARAEDASLRTAPPTRSADRSIDACAELQIGRAPERPNYYDFMTPASTTCVAAPPEHNILWTKMYNIALTRRPPDSIRRVGALRQAEYFFRPRALASLALDRPPSRRHSPPRASARCAYSDQRPRNDRSCFCCRFFTWWNGATLNTLLHTRRHGELVGHRRIRQPLLPHARRRIDPALGFERRWVIYNGVAEASMTPPGWNGWLHHTVDVAADRGRPTSRTTGKRRISAIRPARLRRFGPRARRCGAAPARRPAAIIEAWTPEG